MEANNLICFKCVHFDDINGGCAAFKEIPESITSGENKHAVPLVGQKNKVVFKSV